MRPDDAATSQQVEDATARLLRDVAALSPDQARQQTALPGWTRKHVLSHLARNADGLVNLLTWASTGVVTPMYPDRSTREAEIEAGAARPLPDIEIDVRDSAALLAATVREVPDDAWDQLVRLGAAAEGEEVEARTLLWRRLVELELHHVDLDVGYTAAHWPEGFAERLLTESVERLTTRGTEIRLSVTALDTGWRGVTSDDPQHHVEGPTRALACWVTGRSDGDGLHAVSATGHLTELPELPPWG